MWLRSLSADRLRNLRGVSIDLAAELTVLTGRNGQGKTSLLEAAYLLGTGYSFRTRRFEDLVSRSGGPLRVGGAVSSRMGEEALAVVIDGAERRLVAGGAEVPLDRYLGRLDLVALPGDAPRVLRDGPEGRRRFLDSGIVGMKPTFLKDLGEYRRVLAERNALLRSGRGRDDAGRRKEHEVWEDRLAVAAARVHRERRGYSARLAAALAEPERVILPGAGELVVRFQPSPAESADDGGERFEELFRNALGRGRRRDQGMGFTAIGPHRDDIRVDLDGADLRRFGSGGQVRSAMIALSLAKLGLLRERRGESPLFLMDDFDSDLDEARTAALVEFLHAGRFQAVLTTAKEALVERLAARSVRIRLEGGEAAAF